MFDVGFLELLLVFVVALLVIGPERMPEVVRTVLSVSRTIKRSLHNARMEVEKQIGADEIRRELHNEEIMRSLNESKMAIKNVITDTNGVIQQAEKQIADAPQSLVSPDKPFSPDKPS